MAPNMAHTIILRLLPDRLLWLEAKHENGEARILSGGTNFFKEEEGQSIEEQRKTALRELKSEIDINWFAGCEIILAPPSNIYTARYSKIPPADENTLREATAFEVAETLQIPIEDIAWGYHKSSTQDDSKDIHLIWAAARKQSVSTLLSAFPKNTLYPTQISPDFWAVYDTLLHRNAELLASPALVSYFDGSHLTLFAADIHAVYFTRCVDVWHEDHAARNQILKREIERLIAYVPERFATGRIHNVILCGLQNIAHEELRPLARQHAFDCIQITNSDMQSVLPLSTDVELQPAHFSMLCLIYASMQSQTAGINFMEEEDQTKWWETIASQESLPPKPILQRIGLLAGAVMVLWLAELVWFQYAAASYMEDGKDLLRVANYLNNEETALRNLTRSHIDYDELFIFLSGKLPDNVLVKSISLDTNTGVDLVLTGGNSQLIQPFVDELNQSKYFKDLTESRSAMESGGFTVYLKGKLRI